MSINFKLGRFVPLLVVVLCMLYGFANMFVRLSYIFNDKMEDMSFGWYVPIFSLYVLWTQRRELVNVAARPSWGGLLASIPFCIIALLGSRGLQVRFEQIGFIGLCVTIPWTFFGWRFARCFFFPAVYLLFTIPLSTFLDAVTIYLRLLASSTALSLLHGFGIDAVQNGTAIISNGMHPFSIDVAEPCSGLRSLFALMALTAAYAWFNLPTWGKRFALFASSIPIAVLGNVIRIISICIVAASSNEKFALGFYHDYSGYIVFIFAIISMLGVSNLISRFGKERGGAKADKDEKEEDCENPKDFGKTLSPVVLVSTIVLCAVFVFQGSTPAPEITQPPKIVLPEKMKGMSVSDVFYCHKEQCSASFTSTQLEGSRTCLVCGGEMFNISLGEKTVLPSDTVISRKMYEDYATTYRYCVSSVVGGVNKSSIHRPELCLPAQGFLMKESIDIKVGERPFRVIQILHKNGMSSFLAYTFFNQAGVNTSSHTYRIFTDTWDRSVLNRVDRWVMITIRVTSHLSNRGVEISNPEDIKQLTGFLEKLFDGELKEGEL
ncbi:MAG: exosortase [Kiritimatiellae bacterium]|nr:exosortase [Kiritimatiellia bacterium]